MDILDYIHWRADLSFEERPLNEIDSLIFCTLCYEDFDDLFKNNSRLTINQIADLFFKRHKEEDLSRRKTLTYRSYELLKAMCYTNRYGNLVISNYINQTSSSLNLQFSAMTFEYKQQWKYIAFRGTDDTIIGWKEDFMMIYKDEVLAQRKAAEYVNTILKQHKPFSKTKYYLGGHSKGGNLAIYASAFVPSTWTKRIITIHNFDGPGLDSTFWAKPNVKALLPKITTYIPTSSFFGRLFKNNAKIQIIKSEHKGLLQHNGFHWQVNVDSFIQENLTSEGSDKAISRFNELMNGYTSKEREQLVETLFSIFTTLNIQTIEDMAKINIGRVFNSMKELNDLDNETKKALIEIASMIWELSN